ncbi:MAG: tetratricopeptide repeat protein [Promethearchaeia archaeon]
MFKKFKKEKLDSYISESKELAAINDFKEAIDRLKEGIEYIRDREKEYQTKMDLIKEVEDVMDSVYEDQISYLIKKAEGEIAENNLDEASNILNKAVSVKDTINDEDRKKFQEEEVKLAVEKLKIEKLIKEGNTQRENGQLEKSLETLEKALNKSKELVKEESNLVQKVQNNIDKTYSEKGKFKISKAKEEETNNNIDKAIKILKEGKTIVEKIKQPSLKEENVQKIQDLINKIYAQKIEPILREGEELTSSGEKEEAINTLQNAIKLKDKMYESALKDEILERIAKNINPLLDNKIQPLIEKAKGAKQEKNLEESISAVNEITRTLTEALDLANKMADSENKRAIVQNVSNLIDNTCSIGIDARKNAGLQLIEQKQFDKAISEMYSALSIAKKMTCREEDNEKIDEIKDMVNKVYLAEINEMLQKATSQKQQEEYEKALDTYNEALSLTNKMYLSDETEQKVEEINNLIYETELKGVVSKGEVSDEAAQFQRRINELQKELQDAQNILDEDRKEQKIYEIKKGIDKVHSEQINLFMEQMQQSAKKGDFSEAHNTLKEGLKIKSLIEFEETKKQNTSKILKNLLQVISKAIDQVNYGEAKNYIKKYTQLRDTLKEQLVINNKTVDLIDFLIQECDQLIEKEKYDVAFEFYEISLELGQEIEQDFEYQKDTLLRIKNIYKEKLNDKSFIEINQNEFDNAIKYAKKALELDENYVTTHFNLANAYDLKGNFEQAKSHYQKAVELRPSFKEAWNNLGIIFQREENFSKALECYEKALEIDQNYAEAWYHLGNTYRQRAKIDEAKNCYQKATSLNPDHGLAWLFYGDCYYQQNNYVEALKYFDKAISLDEEIKEQMSALLEDFRGIVDEIQNQLKEIFNLKKLD